MRHLNFLVIIVILESYVVQALGLFFGEYHEHNRIELPFEEGDITCRRYRDGDVYEMQAIDSLSFCDGEDDCMNREDEDPDICAKDLESFRLVVRDSGTTWALLRWDIEGNPRLPFPGSTPSGFLLTRRRGDVVLSTYLEYSEQRSYVIEDLLPYMNYTIILRPYKYRDEYDGHYEVGKAHAVIVHTNKTDAPAHTAPRGLEELDFHCQDPIAPNINITVASKSLCDEVQDCFQGADETKELCGNIEQVQLSVEERAEKFAILKLSAAEHGSPWGTATEERRATIYGRRASPDGFFVTTISNTEVTTPRFQSLLGRRYLITNLNSSTNYTFMVRPYVKETESRRGYRVGKVVSESVMTKTAELQNLRSFYVNGNHAVVLWNAEPDALFFRVTYGNWWSHILRSFPNVRAVDKKNNVFSFIIPSGELPSLFTGAACGNHGCSDDVTMLIDEAGQVPGNPVVKITSIAATSPTSFYVSWTMDSYNFTSTVGYWVRYCAEFATTCRLQQLSKKTLTVTDLTPATTYTVKVQPRIKTRAGNIELGSMSEARVSTWTAVPASPMLYPYHVLTPPCQLHVGWTFYNSTLSFIQISLENDTWLNCTTSAHCNAHVLDNVATAGSLMLWNLEYYTTYKLLVRGCNGNGCGSYSTIVFSTPSDASSAPISLSSERLANGLVLLRWERPLHPRGPLDGYDVSWKCAKETSIVDGVTDLKFLITEPLNGQGCTASVAAYHITEEGNVLRGVEAHIDIPPNNSSDYHDM
ncbi:uncharacterized protein LOC135372411 [Ornithodoros turicata]|uniref:uncharacterized protein LOC135372411 n=1 Tax=Ornithodoros turicata TaxID=34597 RepID=UPI003138B5EF